MNEMVAVQFRADLNGELALLHRWERVSGIGGRQNEVAPIPTNTLTSLRIIAGITRTVSKPCSRGDLMPHAWSRRASQFSSGR
jgi:hypothetical protein